MLARVDCVLSWAVGFVMFLTTVIYAGVRGYNAYNHLPAVQINFQSANVLTFPAVTVCPIEKNLDITPTFCQLEVSDNPTGYNCSRPFGRVVVVSGVGYRCWTFNDDGAIKQSSLKDELAVEVGVNESQVVDHLGVLVILHDQGADPSHQLGRSFWAGMGKLTEVYLRLDQYNPISGATENRWSAAQVGSLNRKEEHDDEVEIDFSIPPVEGQMGFFVDREYYVYDQNNWYGEVGGLACLLLFLHGTFCYLFMEVVSRVYRSKYGHPPDRFDVKYSRQNA